MDTPGTSNSQGRRHLDPNPQSEKVGSVRELVEYLLPLITEITNLQSWCEIISPLSLLLCYNQRIQKGTRSTELQGVQGCTNTTSPFHELRKAFKRLNLNYKITSRSCLGPAGAGWRQQPACHANIRLSPSSFVSFWAEFHSFACQELDFIDPRGSLPTWNIL